MQEFDYIRVTSVDDAVETLMKCNGGAKVLSGGTDLLVALREGRSAASMVVDVKGIPELTELSCIPEDKLEIGAAVPCYRIYGDEQVAQFYPGLVDAASLIGGVQIQGRASFGGNLCNASPAADSIPALIAYDAKAMVAGPDGRREIAVDEFCTGPGRNQLQNGEFLVSLHVPGVQSGFGAAYQRFIPRNEMDIAVVGVGAAVQLDSSGQTFERARIALGAVAPTPLYVAEAGESLVGKKVSDESIAAAAEIARAAARPIDDMRGTARYRKHLVGVLTRRVLSEAVERARASL